MKKIPWSRLDKKRKYDFTLTSKEKKQIYRSRPWFHDYSGLFNTDTRFFLTTTIRHILREIV